MPVKSLGQIAYEAYCAALGRSKKLLPWEKPLTAEQMAWDVASSVAIFEHSKRERKRLKQVRIRYAKLHRKGIKP